MNPRPSTLARVAVLLGAGVVLLLASAAATAWAQARPPTPAPEAAAAATVDGFRSAKFGMTEDEVRQAMRRDFRVGNEAIGRQVNDRERTAALSAQVRDLLPDTGPAFVSYLFGFQSKRMIQANVTWATQAGEARDNLVVVAAVLLNYFSSLRFPAEGRVANPRLRDGEQVVFAARDEKGRSILLVADFPPPPAAAPGAAKPPVPPAAVRLSYVENAARPDVFTPPPARQPDPPRTPR